MNKSILLCHSFNMGVNGAQMKGADMLHEP